MTIADTDTSLEILPDTLEFHRALSEFVRVYQFRDRERICCYDVSVTQCHALESLVRRGPQTLNELAGGLYLDKSTTSRVVDSLEAKGYAERGVNPASGRSVLVSATRAGSALQARIEHDILLEEQRLLADFAPAVRRRMAGLISSLAQAAAARVDARGGSCCSVDAKNFQIAQRAQR